MKTLRGLLLLYIPALSACKKEYECTCTNPGGTETAFITNDNEKKAQIKCDDYYQSHYASVPMNETSCKIE